MNSKSIPRPPKCNKSVNAEYVIDARIKKNIHLTHKPTENLCPFCHAIILTYVKYEADTRTHCWALLLCCFLGLPCAYIPYCTDGCQTAKHYCPECNKFLGDYSD